MTETTTALGTEIDEAPRQHHVCPWWAGYLITNPIRKLGENPAAILSPLVAQGMTAIDIGCGMGFFSLPLARLVGDTGKVIGADIQDRMLSSLRRRAHRRGLGDRIETRLVHQEDLGVADLEGTVDLAIAIHVVHETAYPRHFLRQVVAALRPGGRFLLLEPKGHVTDEEFETTRKLALEEGLRQTGGEIFRKSRSMVFSRPSASS